VFELGPTKPSSANPSNPLKKSSVFSLSKKANAPKQNPLTSKPKTSSIFKPKLPNESSQAIASSAKAEDVDEDDPFDTYMDQINRSAAVQDIDSKAALHAPSHPSSALNDAHIKPNVITLEQLDENDQDPPEPESNRQ